MSFNTTKAYLLTAFIAAVLVLFSTSSLLHEAEHALEDNVAECLICAHATSEDDMIASLSLAVEVTTIPLAFLPDFYYFVQNKVVEQTQHAPRAPPAYV